jgi:hypothetical protein
VTPAALRAHIEASGLSIREWARTVAGRDHRTVLRWLAGEVIPSHAADWLARLGPVHATRSRVTITVSRNRPLPG